MDLLNGDEIDVIEKKNESKRLIWIHLEKYFYKKTLIGNKINLAKNTSNLVRITLCKGATIKIWIIQSQSSDIKISEKYEITRTNLT